MAVNGFTQCISSKPVEKVYVNLSRLKMSVCPCGSERNHFLSLFGLYVRSDPEGRPSKAALGRSQLHRRKSMTSKKSTDAIRWFLLRKIFNEFKLPYLRAFSNYAFFYAIHKVEQTTPLKFTRHRFLKPAALIVQINKICNFDCAFCFVNDLNEKAAKEFTVGRETFEKMLTHPLLNSLIRLGFSGGEPMVHPNLFDYIERAKRRIPIVTFNTNFALAGKVVKGERNIDRINRSSLDMLTISLYERGVTKIEEFAPQLSNRLFKRLSFIVSSGSNQFHTFERMHEVAQMAVRLGFHAVYFQNFDAMEGVPEQKANLNKMDVSSFAPIIANKSSEKYHKYLEVKNRVKTDFSDKIVVTFPIAKHRIENLRKGFTCYQPDFQIGVDEKGSLSPCCNLDRVPEYGNLFRDDNWNNETFRRVRAGIKKRNEIPLPYCANCTYLDVNHHDV
jgi:MoaA/NifB/PqqE/SkfB family radical SAM enzyme